MGAPAEKAVQAVLEAAAVEMVLQVLPGALAAAAVAEPRYQALEEQAVWGLELELVLPVLAAAEQAWAVQFSLIPLQVTDKAAVL